MAQANQDAARIREAEEACADLQARLDAARTQVQKDAVHIMHLTRQLDAERQNAAAERFVILPGLACVCVMVKHANEKIPYVPDPTLSVASA